MHALYRPEIFINYFIIVYTAKYIYGEEPYLFLRMVESTFVTFQPFEHGKFTPLIFLSMPCIPNGLFCDVSEILLSCTAVVVPVCSGLFLSLCLMR